MLKKLIIIVINIFFLPLVFANNELIENKIENSKNIHISVWSGKKELINRNMNIDSKYQQLEFLETKSAGRPNGCLTSINTVEMILVKGDLKIKLSKNSNLNYKVSCLTKEEQEYMNLNGYRIPPKLTELLKPKVIVKLFSGIDNGELNLGNDNGLILKWNYID